MNKGIIYFLIQSCRIYFIPFIYIYNISIEQVSFVDSKKIDKEMRKRKKRKQEKKTKAFCASWFTKPKVDRLAIGLARLRKATGNSNERCISSRVIFPRGRRKPVFFIIVTISPCLRNDYAPERPCFVCKKRPRSLSSSSFFFSFFFLLRIRERFFFSFSLIRWRNWRWNVSRMISVWIYYE